MTSAIPRIQVTIPDAKSDKTYQDTVSGLKRSLADFTARQDLSAQQYKQNYDQQLNTLGYNPTGGQDQKGAFNYNQPGDYHDSMYANQNDFAGRGTFYSGPRAQADAEIDRDFNRRKAEMDLANQQAQATRTSDLGSYQTQQDIVSNSALTDALARLASQYGVNIGEVPIGTTKTVDRLAV